MRAILLSGRGRHFTAGLDLQYASRQFPPSSDPGRAAEARLRHIEWLQDAFSAVEEARPPVIAAIHGGCIGAGVDLATACDMRVAAADAFFQVAEVDVAITADLGTLQRLGHLIAARRWCANSTYTGRRMGAEEAARYGLVNRIGPTDPVAAGLALARTIAAKSPLAVAGAKKSLNYSRGRTIEEGLRDVAAWNAGDLGQRRFDRSDRRASRQARGALRPARRLSLSRRCAAAPARRASGGRRDCCCG